MPVSDWFGEFAAAHVRRFPRQDWPDGEAGREFYAGWAERFVRAGITADVADEASRSLVATPPRFLGEHLPALLKAAAAVFVARQAAEGGVIPGDVASAKAASRGCDDCGGEGLAVRYRHASARGPRDAVTLYCTCAAGRAIESNHRQKSPEVHRRMPDLARLPGLQLRRVPWSDRPDNPHRYPPECWDAYSNRPVPVPDLPPLRRLAAAVARRAEVEQAPTPDEVPAF